MVLRKLPSMPNRLRDCVLLALLVAPAGGCCTAARLFCGPDRTPWVPIEHDTPNATLATFLEAVRRDAPDVIYGCLSAGFRRQHELDGMVVAAAWDKLREETRGLHLLGYAQTPGKPASQDAANAAFELEVEGYSVRIDLVRETYWELRYRGADGRIRETSSLLDDSAVASTVRVAAAPPDPVDDLPQAEVALAPRVAMHPGSAALDAKSVERLAMGREWKIANLRIREP